MELFLFDDIERPDEGPASYAESKFGYLNRTGRPEAGRVRENLENWFSHYPQHQRAEFRSRFRSPNNHQHLAAFFELALHELLIRLGHGVEIHPASNGATAKRPDFLVTSGSGDRFYMEAVLATDQTDQEAAANARLATLRDLLNRMDSPNFFVGFEQGGTPKTSFPANKIQAFLEQKLSALDPDEVAAAFASGGIRSLPHWPYDHDGCIVTFFPIPKSAGKRGKAGVRPVGMQMESPHWIEPELAIRNAITKKARRYGKLDLPYIIAVDAIGDHVEHSDIMEALFGKETTIVSRTASGFKMQPSRIPDGAWRSKTAPRYTTVSAMLLFHPLFPHSLCHTDVRLYHHPWARLPYSGELARLPQAIPRRETNKMESIEGESLTSIFELTANWPYNDAVTGSEADLISANRQP